jgi:hypothetical protein
LLEPLAKVLTREQVEAALQTGGVPQLYAELRAACIAFVSEPTPEIEEVRRVILLALAVASLQLYARQNWTGPPSPDFRGPFDISLSADMASHGNLFLSALEIDGEPVYELLYGVEYLWLGCALMGLLPLASSSEGRFEEIGSLAGGCTLCIWRARCAFTWQMSLAEASERGMGQSPWLFKSSVHDLIGTSQFPGLFTGNGFLSSSDVDVVRSITLPVIDTWRDASGKLKAPSGPPTALLSDNNANMDRSTVKDVAASVTDVALFKSAPNIRSALLAELCFRLCWYGRFRDFDQLLEAACAPMKFSFEITGVLGIKRKYQTQEFAQMAVKTTIGDPEFKRVAPKGNRDDEENRAPENLKLLEIDDMTDILEGPRISKTLDEDERAKLETPLTAAGQILLLTKALHVWCTSNPNDEMTLYIIHVVT